MLLVASDSAPVTHFRCAADTGEGAPSIDLVLEAFQTGVTPESANEEVRKAMRFFLVDVMESVFPRVKSPKNWKLGQRSHLGFFGNFWKFEMATAATLVKHYSDTTNIAHNSSSENRPKKKARMENKVNRAEMSRSYYDLAKHFGKLAKEKGFAERMKLWDDHCLKGRRGDGSHQVVMTNVMPVDIRADSKAKLCTGMEGLGFDSMLEGGFSCSLGPLGPVARV